MNVVNIILGMSLVFGLWIFPRLEVLGAGLALCAANLVGAALVVLVLFRGGRRRLPGLPAARIRVRLRDIFSINRPAIALLFRIGIPAGVEMFAMRIGFLLYVRIIASLGTVALAANAIALRIESLSFMPGMGIAMAATTLVGQSLGAGQTHLAEKSMKRCAWVAVTVMSLMGFVTFVAARPLAALFTPEGQMIGLTTLCLRIAAVEQPLLGFVMVYMGGLRGAGDTVSTMIVSLVGSTFVRVPLVFLLARTLGMGLAGAWLGAVFDWSIRTVITYWLVRRGRWKRLKVDLSPTPTAGPSSS
jgi:putative MATE family efflux protein